MRVPTPAPSPAPRAEAGLSLGSNLGDRLAAFREARRLLLEWPDLRLLAQSPVYETEPVGVRPEHAHRLYLNAVLILEGPASPAEWIRRIGRVEEALGRVRTDDRNAPRTLDLDLLYCGACVADGRTVQVPHPRWASRRFVLQPLADVRPELVLPGAPAPVRTLLNRLPPGEAVTLHTPAAAW